MIAIVFIGTQRGPDHPDGSLDMYNVFEPGHPAHGATFAVPHGAGTVAVSGKAAETARKFDREAAARKPVDN